MIPPFDFKDEIIKLKEVYNIEMAFYSQFFETNELSFTTFDNIFSELLIESNFSNLKNRTILLLKLYIEWYNKNTSYLTKNNQEFLYQLSYEILLLIEKEFFLEKGNSLFFEIIQSLIENDFKKWFYISIPFLEPYELAFDLLLFSKTYPHSNVIQINPLSSIYTNVKFLGNGEKGKVFLEIHPKSKHYFFSRIEILLSEIVDENLIFIYSYSNDNELAQPEPFTHKKKLLDKYAKAVIVDLMYNMEFNKSYFGVKKFLIQKKFLEQFINTYKHDGN